MAFPQFQCGCLMTVVQMLRRHYYEYSPRTSKSVAVSQRRHLISIIMPNEGSTLDCVAPKWNLSGSHVRSETTPPDMTPGSR